MDERRRQFSISEHVEAIAARTETDRVRLVARLLGRSWPGGTPDRSERAALGWIRHWRPGRPTLMPPACGCAKGRCLVCN
jgi:hypothetical protein